MGYPQRPAVTPIRNPQEYEVAERFLDRPGEGSFNALFRLFSPQLVAFFRKRGHGLDVAEDLAQDVMLTVYRKGAQVRDRKRFRAWLFKVAHHAMSRHFAQRSRQVPTVALEAMAEMPTIPDRSPAGGAGFEFNDWMHFLEPQERELMALRFVEDWEYHEIAAARAIPIGTVQWRVFNSKKKLAGHLHTLRDVVRKVA